MSLGEVTIRFAESAVTDLEEIQLWYAEQAVPDVGEGLIVGSSNGSWCAESILSWVESCLSSTSLF